MRQDQNSNFDDLIVKQKALQHVLTMFGNEGSLAAFFTIGTIQASVAMAEKLDKSLDGGWRNELRSALVSSLMKHADFSAAHPNDELDYYHAVEAGICYALSTDMAHASSR